MTDQSGLQSFIQKMQGTHTAGQANTPSAVNNGNPNTVYNWSSYKPTVSSGPTGLPSVNFDLITSQAPASSPGYATPFTADPYAAAVLAGVPRASSPSAVNHLLGTMFGGGNGGGTFTPNPSTGAPVTTPTPTTPTTPNTPTGLTGRGGRPVGPISGPIANNPHNWQANYNNAMPDTNGNGYSTPPWALMPEFQRAANQPSTGNTSLDGARTALTGLWDMLRAEGREVSQEVRDEVNQVLGDLSFTNGWQGALRTALNVLVAPGLGDFIEVPQNGPVLSPQEQAAITNRLNQTLSDMMLNISNNSPQTQAAITNRLNERLSQAINSIAQNGPRGNNAQQIYNAAPQHTARDWQELMNRFGFAQMFQQGRAGDIGSQLMEAAEAEARRIAAMRGEVQK